MDDHLQKITRKALKLINYLPFHVNFVNKMIKYIKLGLSVSQDNSEAYEIRRCPQIKKLSPSQIDCIIQKCIRLHKYELMAYVQANPKLLTNISPEDLIGMMEKIKTNTPTEVNNDPLHESITKILYDYLRPLVDEVMDNISIEREDCGAPAYIQSIIKQATLETLGDDYPNIWKLYHSVISSSPDSQVNCDLIMETYDLNKVLEFVQSLKNVSLIWIVPQQASNNLDALSYAVLYNGEYSDSILPSSSFVPPKINPFEVTLAQKIARDGLCLLSYLPYRVKKELYSSDYSCYISMIITLENKDKITFSRTTPTTWSLTKNKEVIMENVEDLNRMVDFIRSLKKIDHITILPRYDQHDFSLLTENIPIYDRMMESFSFPYLQKLQKYNSPFHDSMATLLAEPPREHVLPSGETKDYFPGGEDYHKAKERFLKSKDL